MCSSGEDAYFELQRSEAAAGCVSAEQNQEGKNRSF